MPRVRRDTMSDHPTPRANALAVIETVALATRLEALEDRLVVHAPDDA